MNTLNYDAYKCIYNTAVSGGIPRDFTVKIDAIDLADSSTYKNLELKYYYWKNDTQQTGSIQAVILEEDIKWMKPNTIYKLSEMEGYEEHHNALMEEHLLQLTPRVVKQIIEELENPENDTRYATKPSLLNIRVAGLNYDNTMFIKLKYIPLGGSTVTNYEIRGIEWNEAHIPYGLYRLVDLMEYTNYEKVDSNATLGEQLKQTGDHYRDLLKELVGV